MSLMRNIGFNEIEKHEFELTDYLLEGLKSINNITIYGHKEADLNKRLGVVSFNIENISHTLLSTILSYEYGIGVRNGCFCAHPYVLKLLKVDKTEFVEYKKRILSGDKSQVPGLVRISMGMYNTISEIDRLLNALENILKGKYSRSYIFDKKNGIYVHRKWLINPHDYFNVD